MKLRSILLMLVVFQLPTFAQQGSEPIEFADHNLEQYLLQSVWYEIGEEPFSAQGIAHDIDLNQDGVITLAEAEAVQGYLPLAYTAPFHLGDMAHFSQLQELFLNIDYRDFRITLPVMDGLKHLLIIKLGPTSSTRELDGFPVLETLTFTGRLDDTLRIANMPRLKSLHLHDTPLNSLELEGVDALETLDLAGTSMEKISQLPDSIEWLDMSETSLTTLDKLPDNLQTFTFFDTPLEALPALPGPLLSVRGSGPMNDLPELPSTLQHLEIQKALLTQLPPLPSTLETLEIRQNRQSLELPELEELTHLTSLNFLGTQLASLPSLPSVLTEIDLTGCGLTQLPELRHLLELTRLRLDYNNLMTLPELPAGLSHLEIEDNQLNALGELSHLVDLESLILRGNNVHRIESLPPNLKELNLEGNPIEYLPELPESLETLNATMAGLIALPQLPGGIQGLWLDYNQLVTLSDLSYLSECTYFSAIGNQLTHIDGLPPNLDAVDLSKNNLQQLPLIPFGIDHLNVSDNQLTQLPELPGSLRTLRAQNNLLISLPDLSQTSLSLVHAFSNQITSLPALPDTLVDLSLADNQITDISPLATIDTMRRLDLSNNQISDVDNLPVNYQISLDLSSNRIKTLPPLETVEILILDDNPISHIEVLPEYLHELSVTRTGLHQLPELPRWLGKLNCSENQLEELPPLPVYMTYLDCSNNQLTRLPDLPKRLLELRCSDNQLETLELGHLDELFTLVANNNRINRFPTGVPQHLVTIELIDNQLEDIRFLVNIEPDPSWSQIQLEGNPLDERSCAVFQVLREKSWFLDMTLPECDTTFDPLDLNPLQRSALMIADIIDDEGNVGSVDRNGDNQIDCYEALRVREIELPNRYVGRIADFSEFAGLNRLVLKGARLQGLSRMQELVYLKELDLSFNLVAEIPELPKGLEILNIAHNRLTGIDWLPDGLLSLNCQSNQVEYLPEVLPVQLEELYVSANRLTELPNLGNRLLNLYCHSNELVALPALPQSLRLLYAGYNQLTDLPASSYALRTLSVPGNQITELPTLLSYLRELDVSENPIDTLVLPSPAFGRFILRASYTQITALPKLPWSMELLDVRHTPLNDLGDWRGVHHIDAVNLAYNQLEDITALGQLSPNGLSETTVIDLVGNYLSDDDCDVLNYLSEHVEGVKFAEQAETTLLCEPQ